MSLGPLMVDVAGTELTREDREILAHPLVGSVILFTRNYVDPAQLQLLAQDIHAVRSPPLLIGVDHEGGRVQRFRSGFSALPALRHIGHLYDLDAEQGLETARRLGWLMAAELLAVGVDLSFAPCVDLDYGVSEVIGDRALHRRAESVARLAVAYVHGMRAAGMAATAKHFPGHGAVVADSHLALPVDRRELADLQDDLIPYRRLIDNGLPGIMVAHVLFPAVDALPASFSAHWVGGILRRELGFTGAVFTDDLSMAAAADIGDVLARAGQALSAGCDVLPVCNDRANLIRLIDGLKIDVDPASRLRLVRMRGRHGASLSELRAGATWQSCQEWLRRCTAAPQLEFDA
jgi:beta-N-acetylhexosaminidase